MPEAVSADAVVGVARMLRPDAGPPFTLADLAGTWAVRRVIVDHLSGAIHRFQGTAVIRATDFVETGEVRSGAACFKANRRYGLRYGAAGLDIVFADGRPFVRLEAQASQAVRHLCGEDDYRGRFYLRHANLWAEAWRVAGPRKRYASLALYAR